MTEKRRICILGLGYIGLPTAAMFATHGHNIVGVDIDTKVVEALNNGQVIIEEPYLDIMVQAAVSSGNLIARSEPVPADVFIIAVPTPITGNKQADLNYVRAATQSIVPVLSKDNIVILESTSPTGTTEGIVCPILEQSGLKPGVDLYVAHSPERVLPGQILMELVNNNRIVGGINRESAELVRDLYRTFVRGEIFLTDAGTAEMCKMMENTFRDVNIALANELACLCEKMGLNAWEVITLCNKHPRVNLHQPGPGVGGHCLAVDPWFIVEQYPETAKLIRLAREINDSMPYHVKSRIDEILAGVEGKKVVTILGLTYKADIDDLRESPILKLIQLLEQQEDMEIRVMDPFAKRVNHQVADLLAASRNSDLLVLAVNHTEYKHLDFTQLGQNMRTKNILDTRKFWNKEDLVKQGFSYYLLGCK